MSKQLFFLLIFLGLALITFSQSNKRDSTFNHYDSLSKVKLNHLESSQNRTNYKVDSIQSNVNNLVNPDLKNKAMKGKVSFDKRNKKKDSINFYKRLDVQRARLAFKIDSLSQAGQPVVMYSQQLDSLNNITYSGRRETLITSGDKRDSAQQRMKQLLNPNMKDMTSRSLVKIKKRIEKKDSIRYSSNLNARRATLQLKIDSLGKQGLPTEEYEIQRDSLNKMTYSSKIESSAGNIRKGRSLNKGVGLLKDSLNQVKPLVEVNELQSKTKNVHADLNRPVTKLEGNLNEKLSLMNKEGGETNLPGKVILSTEPLDTKLYDVAVTNTKLKVENPVDKINTSVKKQSSVTNDLQVRVGKAKQIPQDQIDKLKSTEEMIAAQEKLAKANKITDKAQVYQKEVKDITNGDLQDVKEFPKTLQTQVEKRSGLGELKEQTGQFDQYKVMGEKGKDPSAVEGEAIKQVTTLAIDHFAGNEKALQETMDRVAKLKTKYSAFTSTSELSKRRPYSLKGKPIIERIVPGLTIQVQKSADVLIDYYPLVGFQLSVKFTAGLGWNERIGIGNHFYFTLRDRIYGPRVFGDFKIGKGFSVRTEFEKMNTYVPSANVSGTTSDPQQRAWVWSAFIGIKKDYKFSKGVRGNFQIAYNLYDDHYNSPYADRLNMRTGFEFPMKKNKRKKQ